MRRSTVFLCLIAFAVAAADAAPSKTLDDSNINEHGSKIVGGVVSQRTQFPWQVYVQSIVGGNVHAICSGSLISRDFVLTSADCLSKYDSVLVHLGGFNQTNPIEAGLVVLESTTVAKHPDFQETNLLNDIAIIQLPIRVWGSPYIRPIRLPALSDAIEENYVGWYARLSGWGFLKDLAYEMAPLLHFVDVGLLEPEVCETHYGEGWMTPDKLCSDTMGGRGPCFGDGGSPLVIQDYDGLDTQIGIFSFLDTASCSMSSPVGYTKLQSYLLWIEAITGIAARP